MVNPEAMRNIRVVTVEVGTVDTDGHQHHRRETSGSILTQTSMEDWSASEKSVYGQSFLNVNGRTFRLEVKKADSCFEFRQDDRKYCQWAVVRRWTKHLTSRQRILQAQKFG